MSGKYDNDPRNNRPASALVFSESGINRPLTPYQEKLTLSPKLTDGKEPPGGHNVPKKFPPPPIPDNPSRQNSNNHHDVRQTLLTTLDSIVNKLFDPNNQEIVEQIYQELMNFFLKDERFAAVFPKLAMLFFKKHAAFMDLFDDEQHLDFSYLVTSTLNSGAISNHLNNMSLTSIITLILIMLDTQGTTLENQNKIDVIVDQFFNKWEQTSTTSTPMQSALFSTDQILFLVSHISDEQNKLKVLELIQTIANNPKFTVNNEGFFNQLIDELLKAELIEPHTGPHTEPRPSSANSRSASGGSGSGGSK